MQLVSQHQGAAELSEGPPTPIQGSRKPITAQQISCRWRKLSPVQRAKAEGILGLSLAYSLCCLFSASVKMPMTHTRLQQWGSGDGGRQWGRFDGFLSFCPHTPSATETASARLSASLGRSQLVSLSARLIQLAGDG